MTGPGLGIDVNEELIRKEDAQYRAGQVNAWRNESYMHLSVSIRTPIRLGHIMHISFFFRAWT